MFILSILIAVLSNVFYHLTLKFTPNNVNPAVSLFVTYSVAALLCLALFCVFPLQEGLMKNLKSLNWTSYVLGLAILGLEVAFLFAYRSGWEISLAALVVNSSVSVLLLPLGYVLFREALTPVNLLGALLAIAGLVMVNL